MHPSYEPKRPYVGLIVLRGYSQSVSVKAASLHPSSHFQKEYIERWADEHEIEIKRWCAISEEYSRPILGANQSVRAAITEVKRHGGSAVIDDASRLIDASNEEEIYRLQRFFGGQALYLHSVLQNAPVFSLTEERFAEFIKPRLHAVHEAIRTREIEEQMRAKGQVPRYRPAKLKSEEAEKRSTGIEDVFMAQNIFRAHGHLLPEDRKALLSVSDIVEELNRREVPTMRGKPWTSANFRRWLNQFRARNPDHPVLSKVKLSGSGA
ncbi:hypothetical protein [Labrenzia sp. VG12]|uniref:hypothetical protein n=1 Tax=Labrenzia sp. VG12 TaxID=2021862 RepID=UPI000B8C4C4D|nr:hypothetical protein [Labrenzia sp. VG12]ASP34091.1 hypothetical protein CHH27_13250 [Labrenzia sp. VG12]